MNGRRDKTATLAQILEDAEGCRAIVASMLLLALPCDLVETLTACDQQLSSLVVVVPDCHLWAMGRCSPVGSQAQEVAGMYGGAVVAYGKVCSGQGARGSARADECPPTFGTGRVCTAEGCETVLSSYNPSSVCCLHSQGWAAERRALRRPRRTDDRPELAGTCQNPRCGAAFVTTTPTKKFCSDRCRMQAYQLRLASQDRSHATV